MRYIICRPDFNNLQARKKKLKTCLEGVIKLSINESTRRPQI